MVFCSFNSCVTYANSAGRIELGVVPSLPRAVNTVIRSMNNRPNSLLQSTLWHRHLCKVSALCYPVVMLMGPPPVLHRGRWWQDTGRGGWCQWELWMGRRAGDVFSSRCRQPFWLQIGKIHPRSGGAWWAWGPGLSLQQYRENACSQSPCCQKPLKPHIRGPDPVFLWAGSDPWAIGCWLLF